MLWVDLDRLGSLWDPWREFELMRRASARTADLQEAEFPAVNIWTSADNAVLTTEIPGIDPGSLDISVVGDTVTLRGSREPETLKEGDTYHRRERWYGKFGKTIRLPFPIQSDKVEARFSKGVLVVNLPRAEADKPKKIAIKSE